MKPYIAHFGDEEGLSLGLEGFVYLAHLCPLWDSDSSWALLWKVHREIIQLNINILLSCCKIAFQLACGNCCKHQDLRDVAELPLKQRFGFNLLSGFIDGTWHHIPTLQSVQIIHLLLLCCKRGALHFCRVSCKEKVKNLCLKFFLFLNHKAQQLCYRFVWVPVAAENPKARIS